MLDPFLGAGTTALVAACLGRDCLGPELSPGYAKMAYRQIASAAQGGVRSPAPSGDRYRNGLMYRKFSPEIQQGSVGAFYYIQAIDFAYFYRRPI